MNLFDGFDVDNKRSITAWQPVVTIVMNGITSLDERTFDRNVTTLYIPCINLLNREISTETRKVLHKFLKKAGRNVK
jgi:hypothetical protein